MTRTSLQRDQTLRRVVQKNRSRECKIGRGRFRLRISDLLAQGEDLKGGVGSAAKKDANDRQDGENALRHEITLVT